MDIEFDPVKNDANIAKHGVALSDFAGFDEMAATVVDDRFDYGETRFRGFGRIAGEGFCIVYVETNTGIRLISFRRAHEKEMRRYE
jgi:uncharacterized DUF497 family protein